MLEHVLSEELEELIAAKLGNPTRDPHGDPIPTPRADDRGGPTQSPRRRSAPGARGTFTRISDSDPDMLRFLAERGIAPGDEFEVIDKQPFDGPLFVRFGDEVHVLGGSPGPRDARRGGRVDAAAPDRVPAAADPGWRRSRSPADGRRRQTGRRGGQPARAAAPARARCGRMLTMLGPAFVAAVAYVDPGNFATNIQGGARFGYALLWVVLLANLMAMLIQYLSAKLGIVTGRNLPSCAANGSRDG